MSVAKTGPRLPPHVQAAIAAAAQAKIDGPGHTVVAPHVHSAVATAQAKGASLEIKSTRLDPAPAHVRAGIAAAAQGRVAEVVRQPLAPHVRNAISAAQAKIAPSAGVDVPGRLGGPGPRVFQPSASTSANVRAEHLQNAIGGGSIRPTGPGLPAVLNRSGRVVQQSESDDEYLPTKKEKRAARAERKRDRREKKLKKKILKARRPSKPKGLQELMRQGLTQTDSGDEEKIFKKRLKVYKKTKYKKKPSPFVKSHYKGICRRCGRPIYFDQSYKELGVIHSNDERHEAPLGHKIDYSTYKKYLEIKKQELLSKKFNKKKVKKWVKHVTWNQGNLAYEHYDCNATAPKITHKNMTTKQRTRGENFVTKLLKEFKKKN